MKAVIFAGGVGTRLWPLSRKNTPKQFEKIIGENSTLQETVQRLLPDISHKDIFIATGKRYEEIIKGQLSDIPHENFIFEPEMRDVGPAIGLVAAMLAEKFPNEPIAILWSDHMVKNVSEFKNALSFAEKAIKNEDSKFVFIGQKPRFPNQNMGWIEVGEELGNEKNIKAFTFKGFKYRPSIDEASQFFKSEKFYWNLGYFVTTPSYLLSLFKEFAPEVYSILLEIREAKNDSNFESILQENYSKLEKISFDDLILMKMPPEGLLVIACDLGWSDIGAWESLKEALAEHEDENVTKGNVILKDSRDSLVYNYTKQMVVGIDLDELLVINTQDVVLICPKGSVPKIKKLVESLSGTENEHLT
ncbi:MAG: mannose-1-phosphate guanylyltransferase [Candidatus Levybacteria bacterium]|nr:mannose-1-phosphate guanylyltransferase [Candidatus Levybacteria bacterium]